MMGPTHLAIGVGGVMLLNRFVPLWDDSQGLMLTMGAAVVSSLLADIDEPGSMISRMLKLNKREGVIATVRSSLTGAHRMTTHTPDLAGVIACLPLIVLLGLWLSLPLVTSSVTVERILFLVSLRGVCVALAVGYLSHLIADAMTPHGIPLFFFDRQVHLLPRGLRIRTGEIAEYLVVGVPMLLILGIVILN